MPKVSDGDRPAQTPGAGIDADQQQAQHAVAARFDITGHDPALDALGAALEGFRRTRAEAAAELCPCGEGANPLHALVRHHGGRP